MTKRLLTAAGVLISLACLLFFVHAISEHWRVLARVTLSHAVWVSLAPALALYLATYPVVSFAWCRSLKAIGRPLPYLTAMQILLKSQFAKYLPGNVGHHIGRVLLGNRAGLPFDAVVGSMLLDTLLVLTAAATCSLPAAQLLAEVTFHQAADRVRTLGTVVVIAAILGLTVLLLPRVRRMAASQASRLRQFVRPRTLPQLGAAWAAHCVNFVAGGTALYLLCSAFAGSMLARDWGNVVGIYSAAWLLGFLLPGAPAGIGVREVVLMLGLGPLLGPETATASAAALRLVTTLGDGLAFALGFALPGGDNEGITPSRRDDYLGR